MVSTYIFALSVCIPALPIIAKHFGTNINDTQNLIIMYVIGLGVSQLVYGVLSDYIGRKQTIILGVLLFVCGCELALEFHSLQIMVIARFIQGLGAGCFSVVGKSIMRDISLETGFVKAIASMMLVAVFMQILSPIIGGYLIDYFSWQWVFYLIFFSGLIALIVILLFLPETNRLYLARKDIVSTKDFTQTISEIKNVLVNKELWHFMIISASALAIITIFQVASPFVLQSQMNIKASQFGFITIINATGFITGTCFINWLIRKNTKRDHSNYLNNVAALLMGIIIMIVGAALLYILSSYQSIVNVMGPMFVVSIGTGIVLPLATSCSLIGITYNIGLASAIVGSGQMLIAALVTSIASSMQLYTQLSLACSISIVAVLVLLYFLYIFDPLKSYKKPIRKIANIEDSMK